MKRMAYSPPMSVQCTRTMHYVLWRMHTNKFATTICKNLLRLRGLSLDTNGVGTLLRVGEGGVRVEDLTVVDFDAGR